MYASTGLAPNPQASIITSGSAGYPATTPRPQVEDQIDNLQTNAKDLSEIVSRLTSKLAPITNVRLNENSKAQNIPEPVLVPLASRLREVSSGVRGTVDHLRDLCTSIELSE